MRNPKYFNDPDKFDINRFLGNDKSDYNYYLPFSIGPRNCIGQHMAKMEAKIIFIKMLKKFTIHVDTNQTLKYFSTISYGAQNDDIVTLKLK